MSDDEAEEQLTRTLDAYRASGEITDDMVEAGAVYLVESGYLGNLIEGVTGSIRLLVAELLAAAMLARLPMNAP